ncbi:hypothetical protein [Rhodopila sp.]|uniref:hypothetical protein n=1 Tax=Rhodopila sp. TaxID=2480087 RepID=UPI003D0EA2ED
MDQPVTPHWPCVTRPADAEVVFSKRPFHHLQEMNLGSEDDAHSLFTVVRYRGSALGWDDFAIRCGGSFRTAYPAGRIAQIGWGCHRLTRLMILRDGIRVGQTAVAVGLVNRYFVEGIQMFPGTPSRWRSIMQAVLRFLGPGNYRYGSPWSLEPARDRDLLAIGQICIKSSHPIDVFAIDFARWPSWEDYLKAVSSNAKRNAKKAMRTFDDLSFDHRTGLGCLRHAGPHVRLRYGLYTRKRLSPRVLRFATRFTVRVSVLKRRCFSITATGAGEVIAAFGGIRFGSNVYYLESSARKNNNGVSWLMMLRLIKQSYQRAPAGAFVTGYHRHGTPLSPGLEVFRAQCCAVAHPTSEILFSYAATEPAQPQQRDQSKSGRYLRLIRGLFSRLSSCTGNETAVSQRSDWPRFRADLAPIEAARVPARGFDHGGRPARSALDGEVFSVSRPG